MQRVSRSLKIHGDGFLGYLRNSFADRNRTSSNLNNQYLNVAGKDSIVVELRVIIRSFTSLTVCLIKANSLAKPT